MRISGSPGAMASARRKALFGGGVIARLVLADRIVDPDGRAACGEAAEVLFAELAGRGVIEKFAEQARKIAERLAVPPAARQAPRGTRRDRARARPSPCNASPKLLEQARMLRRGGEGTLIRRHRVPETALLPVQVAEMEACVGDDPTARERLSEGGFGRGDIAAAQRCS